MIEIVTCNNGLKVLRYAGRLLASRFDPEVEAQHWLNSRREFLETARTVFVLGLGSGYHVGEILKRTTANVIVLEASTEVIAANSEFHSFDPLRVNLIPIVSARTLRSQDAVREAIQQSFIVLSYAPSVSLSPELYAQCRAQLIGRDWGTLNWQWKIKGGPNFDTAVQVTKVDSPLTIYDLEQTELVQNSEERERLLFKALRELVK